MLQFFEHLNFIDPLNSETLLQHFAFCPNISCNATQVATAKSDIVGEFTILRTSNGNYVTLQLEIRDQNTSMFPIATVYELLW